MPLSRYLLRNEYSLGDPEVYKEADKNDPEALLEGIAMSGLIGILRQLGDLAEFAAELFHDLYEEVMATSARGHGLLIRVQQLEVEMPSIERTFLSETNHIRFSYETGSDWHPGIRTDENVVTQGNLPHFVMEQYEESRPPPRLISLDKFDVAGAGACLKRFSDPSFFRIHFASSQAAKVEEVLREKRSRKAKKKALRRKNEDTLGALLNSRIDDSPPSEKKSRNSKFHSQRVKLKKRNMNHYITAKIPGSAYMKIILQDHISEEQELPANIPLKLSDMNRYQTLYSVSGIENNDSKLTPKSSPPANGQIRLDLEESVLMLASNGSDFNLIPNGKTEIDRSELSPYSGREIEPIYEVDKLGVLISDRETVEVDADVERFEDFASEVESYTDALATIQSEIETDTECEVLHDSERLSVENHDIHLDGKEVDLHHDSSQDAAEMTHDIDVLEGPENLLSLYKDPHPDGLDVLVPVVSKVIPMVDDVIKLPAPVGTELDTGLPDLYLNNPFFEAVESKFMDSSNSDVFAELFAPRQELVHSLDPRSSSGSIPSEEASLRQSLSGELTSDLMLHNVTSSLEVDTVEENSINDAENAISRENIRHVHEATSESDHMNVPTHQNGIDDVATPRSDGTVPMSSLVLMVAGLAEPPSPNSTSRQPSFASLVSSTTTAVYDANECNIDNVKTTSPEVNNVVNDTASRSSSHSDQGPKSVRVHKLSPQLDVCGPYGTELPPNAELVPSPDKLSQDEVSVSEPTNLLLSPLKRQETFHLEGSISDDESALFAVSPSIQSSSDSYDFVSESWNLESYREFSENTKLDISLADEYRSIECISVEPSYVPLQSTDTEHNFENGAGVVSSSVRSIMLDSPDSDLVFSVTAYQEIEEPNPTFQLSKLVRENVEDPPTVSYIEGPVLGDSPPVSMTNDREAYMKQTGTRQVDVFPVDKSNASLVKDDFVLGYDSSEFATQFSIDFPDGNPVKVDAVECLEHGYQWKDAHTLERTCSLEDEVCSAIVANDASEPVSVIPLETLTEDRIPLGEDCYTEVSDRFEQVPDVSPEVENNTSSISHRVGPVLESAVTNGELSAKVLENSLIIVRTQPVEDDPVINALRCFRASYNNGRSEQTLPQLESSAGVPSGSLSGNIPEVYQEIDDQISSDFVQVPNLGSSSPPSSTVDLDCIATDIHMDHLPTSSCEPREKCLSSDSAEQVIEVLEEAPPIMNYRENSDAQLACVPSFVEANLCQGVTGPALWQFETPIVVTDNLTSPKNTGGESPRECFNEQMLKLHKADACEAVHCEQADTSFQDITDNGHPSEAISDVMDNDTAGVLRAEEIFHSPIDINLADIRHIVVSDSESKAIQLADSVTESVSVHNFPINGDASNQASAVVVKETESFEQVESKAQSVGYPSYNLVSTDEQEPTQAIDGQIHESEESTLQAVEGLDLLSLVSDELNSDVVSRGNIVEDIVLVAGVSGVCPDASQNSEASEMKPHICMDSIALKDMDSVETSSRAASGETNRNLTAKSFELEEEKFPIGIAVLPLLDNSFKPSTSTNVVSNDHGIKVGVSDDNDAHEASTPMAMLQPPSCLNDIQLSTMGSSDTILVSNDQETEVGEMPPLPPLPPMQWILGKTPQNHFGLPGGAAEIPSLISSFPIAGVNDPSGGLSWIQRARNKRSKDPLIEALASHDKSTLKKVNEGDPAENKPKVEERNNLLEQIKNKSFNLKPAAAKRPMLQGPPSNLKVAAIIEKANAIRQAYAGNGSDEDDESDKWSDT